mmetsp:Transcript_53114/g.140221  ORF Transcript_53114/g.140221 Transcript_53114/m.140221 type:complete len:146 (-) Transcript_53114:54-491(-)
MRCLRVAVQRCTYCFGHSETLQDFTMSLGNGASWLQIWSANSGIVGMPDQIQPGVPAQLGALYYPRAVRPTHFKNSPFIFIFIPALTAIVEQSDTLRSLGSRFLVSPDLLALVNPDAAVLAGVDGFLQDITDLCIMPGVCENVVS